RKAEATLALLAYQAARAQEAAAQQSLAAAVEAVASQAALQAEAAREQAVAAHKLPVLREAEAEASAALVRLRRGLDELEAANRRGKQRAAELAQRLTEL